MAPSRQLQVLLLVHLLLLLTANGLLALPASSFVAPRSAMPLLHALHCARRLSSLRRSSL